MNSFSTTIGRQIETIEAKDAFRDLNQCKELVPFIKSHTRETFLLELILAVEHFWSHPKLFFSHT